jgi:3-oxoacyl-[acyl-carrier protein] reductase
MELGLAGRAAIVTGGSKGIGRAISVALAAEGVRVAIMARSGEALDDTCAAIQKAGHAAIGVHVDAMDGAQIGQAVAQAVQTLGGLDILVNNAGGAIRFGGWGELTDADWMQSYDLNVLGLVRFVRAAESELRRSRAPRIVNIASISGVQPGTYNPHYSAAKAATINLGKYLANLYAKDRILVNTVCPGPVHSESWNRNIARLASQSGISIEEAFNRVEKEEAAKIPLGRVGEGDDIASMVVYLASDRAKWITGSCFHVNGGKLQSV